MMRISVTQAWKAFGAILDRVRRAEALVATRRGKPMARLMSTKPTIDREAADASMARIRARAVTLNGGFVQWDILKIDRDTGRP